MSGVFSELRRRNVFRVAAAYAVIAWITLEVLATVLPIFGVPDWVLRLVVILVVAGFVPAVFFAWAFELTPEGIKRESEVDRSAPITDQTAKKLDVIVIVLLVVAIGFVMLDRLVLDSRTVPTPQVTDTDRIDSIAVLPFEDFTPGGDHAYLGTGIADTILHSLAQIDGLKVAARTSSFQLHEQNAGIPAIGRTLGVGAVLEGSVQVAGDRLRIIAQLVRVSDQSHLWSETFASTTEDIFATQDTIAEAVAATLRGVDASDLTAQERTSLEVFELVAKGRHLWQQINSADTAAAVTALERAVELDPDYAQAHAELAVAYYFNQLYGAAERATAIEAARTAAGRALELDETLSQPWAVRGLIADNPEEAISAYERALELNPNNANAMTWLSLALKNAGVYNESRQMIERAYRRDPMSTYVRGAYAWALANDMDPASHQRAIEIVEGSLQLEPGAFRAVADAAVVNRLVGDPVTAAEHYVTGLRMQPDSIELHYGLLQVLFMAGESDAISHWGANMDTFLPDAFKGGAVWKYLLHDHDSFLAYWEAMHVLAPDDPYVITQVALALATIGRYRESIEWHERARDALRAERFRDMPNARELKVRHRLIWLYEHAGQADYAAALREEIRPMFETLVRNGLDGSPSLLINHLIALGDLEAAVTALRDLDNINGKYFAFLWQDAPWWEEFKQRDEVRAILQEWREEQDRLSARLRAEAPPVVFDPSLL